MRASVLVRCDVASNRARTLLVDMDPDRSLLDIVGLGQDLEELLDREVDVLTATSLYPALRNRILAESRPL